MSTSDYRGYSISGATPAALDAYERAFGAVLAWRSGADVALDRALQDAPGFMMAHVLQAYLLLGSRDLRRVQAARPMLARVTGLPANERERLHLTAISAVVDDDYENAKVTLGKLLRQHPRDALALHVAHSLDYLTGDSAISDRVSAVLPAWSRELPGYHAVLAMHAFGLHEAGECARAERAARAALDLNPADARAHHVLAHVFETTDRAEDGLRWMNSHIARWSEDTVVATHCWWHMALFHLTQGEAARALALYDGRVRTGYSSEISDLIDAAALLWRVQLLGGETGLRWAELANAWACHINDRFCSFSDLHAMLAFVGARDWARAQDLERTLAKAQLLPTRHGWSTRHIGLPACRALIAFGRGDHTLAITLLASLPAMAHRLGGSHAQRDVLHLTMLNAIERVRRPARRQRTEPPPVQYLGVAQSCQY